MAVFVFAQGVSHGLPGNRYGCCRVRGKQQHVHPCRLGMWREILKIIAVKDFGDRITQFYVKKRHTNVLFELDIC